jgi:hypothetical protein
VANHQKVGLALRSCDRFLSRLVLGFDMATDRQIEAAARVAINNGCDKAHAIALAKYMLLAAESVGSSPTANGQAVDLFDDWPSDFLEQFWSTYPRRIGKKAVLAKLETIRKSHLPFAKVMAGVERYARSVRGAEMQFIAHPETWLNQGRWDDEEKSLERESNTGKNGFAALVRDHHGV